MSGAASKPRIYEFLVQTLHSFSAKLLTWQVAAKTKRGIRSPPSPDGDLFVLLPLAVLAPLIFHWSHCPRARA